jgi:hypothetical protein
MHHLICLPPFDLPYTYIGDIYAPNFLAFINLKIFIKNVEMQFSEAYTVVLQAKCFKSIHVLEAFSITQLP